LLRDGPCKTICDFVHNHIRFDYMQARPTRTAFGPMDFSAWIEVFLEGEWHTFDPRNNTARIGRIVVARDVTDIPSSTRSAHMS
jgi:transglutaminase-like putative cysteine protease